jgi:phosphoribosylformimino-5-aminoimidazole carboxamide ribotide isomerase
VIVIPAIDLRGGRVVRLAQGDPSQETEYGRDPVAVARQFEANGARWLHVVDLDAALDGGTNQNAIASIVKAVGIPVQVGGGLRSPDAVDAVLSMGAARAVLGTVAATDPDFVRRAVDRHGDNIVVALDVSEGWVMVRGWQVPARPVVEAIAALDVFGAPRFLVTSILADGMLAGPDMGLYRGLVRLTTRPILASGGVRTELDVRALAGLGVEGVVVGKALYEGTLTLPEVATI